MHTSSPPRHSREGGNPWTLEMPVDSRFRGNDDGNLNAGAQASDFNFLIFGLRMKSPARIL
jgi:hypothetical protein